jgi:hypothetical protein
MVENIFFRKKFLKIYLIIIFFILNFSLIFSEEIEIIGEKPIIIEADYLAYSFDEELIIATGNVNVKVGKIKITSDSLQLDLDKRFLQAQGRITIGEAERISSYSKKESEGFLEIEFPPEGFLTTNSILEVSGKILPGYILYINGEKVEQELTGRFSKEVILLPGENSISFLAIDENENKIEIVRKVTYTTSSVSFFQGDVLKLDLSLLQGCVFKVGEKLEKIYFEGETLKTISKPIADFSYNIEIPDIVSAGLAAVAKRIRIIFGKSLEAWDVTFYTKGVKSISLPYYTSSVETTFAEIPFQLTGVNYSSNQHLSISSRLHYLSKEKRHGFLNLNYVSKYKIKNTTKEKWTCDLEQHFVLGEKNTGTFYFSRLGEPKWNASIVYQHFFKKDLEGSLNTSYSIKEFLNSSLILKKRYSISDVNFSIYYNKNLSYLKQTNLNYSFSYQTRPLNLENTKIAYTYNLLLKSYKTKKPDFEDWEGEFGLNIFKSGISLFPYTSLNLRTYYSMLLSLKGKYSTSYGFSSTINLRFKSIYLNINHSTSIYNSTTIQNIKSKSFNRDLSYSLLFGKKTSWSCQFSTNYNLKEKEFVNIRPSLDIKINRLLRTNFFANYNFKTNKWTDLTISATYSIFGEKSKRRLQGIWYYKRKEYFLSLSSMI